VRELASQRACEMLLPVQIGDYTDFYASLHHASNVGNLLRPGNPLTPNYRHHPIAYHGRASSIVVSGTPIRRPSGQLGEGVFGVTRELDYELEIGAFLGPGNSMGEAIPIDRAEEHIAGICLVNDWSARDIQRWEYQPLGPFLGKNFATSISPWMVTLEALEPFRTRPPRHEAPVLPYLKSARENAFEITLEVRIKSREMSGPELISKGYFQDLYWPFDQMVAHHTSNGCPLRPGDLIASGTISGPQKLNRGCLLELTEKGRVPLRLSSGEQRAFLEDGDQVLMTGFCAREGYRRIGLGECTGHILCARDRKS
jgi:fumarylacetoacetase